MSFGIVRAKSGSDAILDNHFGYLVSALVEIDPWFVFPGISRKRSIDRRVEHKVGARSIAARSRNGVALIGIHGLVLRLDTALVHEIGKKFRDFTFFTGRAGDVDHPGREIEQRIVIDSCRGPVCPGPQFIRQDVHIVANTSEPMKSPS